MVFGCLEVTDPENDHCFFLRSPDRKLAKNTDCFVNVGFTSDLKTDIISEIYGVESLYELWSKVALELEELFFQKFFGSDYST